MTFFLPIVAAVDEGGHSGNPMLETIAFPLIAISVFIVLGLVTMSYRHVANRHPQKSAAYAQKHAKELEPTGHGH